MVPGPIWAPPAWLACASELVTVVLETCLDPDDRLPEDDPALNNQKYITIRTNKLIKLLPELLGECWLPLDAVLGGGGPGGLGPFRGLPGGKISVIDRKLAIEH